MKTEFLETNNMKQLIVFLTHETSDFSIQQFNKLVNDLGKEKFDFVYLLNNVLESKDNLLIPESIKDYVVVQDKSQLDTIRKYKLSTYVDIEQVERQREYEAKYFCPNCALFLYLWDIDYSKYDFIYFIEYDVYFNGDWKTIMHDLTDNLQEYDFLTTNILRYNDCSSTWWWWNFNNNLFDWDLEDHVKCLNNFCRFSKEAINKMLERYKSGKQIHFYELFWPTFFKMNELKIGDIGNNEFYTIPGYENKYYETAHFNFEPVLDFSSIDQKNKLYHPVKSYDK